MLPTDDVAGAFESTADPEYEVLLDDGITEEVVEKQEPASPGVMLDREALAELIAKGQSGASVTQGFEKLAESLAQRGPANMQVAPTDDYDPAKLEEELWKPGKATEVIGKVAARIAAQQQGQNAFANQEMEKRLLKLDPETSDIFRKYENEIEKRVQTLPPQYRMQPNVYSQVYRVIMQEKQGEIIQDKASKMAEEIAQRAVAEALAQAGIKSAPKPGVAMQMETEGAAAPRAKQVLKLTSSDVMRMQESGMDHKDVDQVKAYLRWKQAKGIK